jgi:hypothetical protein
MDVAIGYHRSGRAARRAASEIGALGGRVTRSARTLPTPGMRDDWSAGDAGARQTRRSRQQRRDLRPHAVVRFFATCPPYITGQVLKVDGGEGVTS